jgi:Holliday junction resolvase
MASRNEPMIAINLTRSQWELVVGVLEDKSMKIDEKIKTGIKYQDILKLRTLATQINNISSDIADSIE